MDDALTGRIHRAPDLTAGCGRATSSHFGPTGDDGTCIGTAPPTWARARYTMGGEGWAVSTTTIQPGIAPPRLTLIAYRECSFRVEFGANPQNANAFRLLDSEGNSLEILCMRGFGGVLSTEFELTDGKSEVLTVGEHAVTLVLQHDDEEVTRMPVTLRPDGVHAIGG